MAQQIQGKMPVLGLMSGTSLDGLDLALCEFERTEKGYGFSIIKAETLAYSPEWKQQLSAAKDVTAGQYFALHAHYGSFIAARVNAFLATCPVKPEAIASHGHTVFHQPQLGFSTQVGCGATIAAQTGITTVCDFRSLDVAHGGQGAPLVPVGDQLLFAGYAACLNLGGIANISFNDAAGDRRAYDICEANMLLNLLASLAGQAFDKDGAMARAGTTDQKLLSALNALPYYQQKGAKSIGREWFETNVQPLIGSSLLSLDDLLATCTTHVAQIIASELNALQMSNVLVTGGGAYNSFLIEQLRSRTRCNIVLPSQEIINFKEAIIFAFLAYLRLHEQQNTLSSVTGARTSSVGGAVYLGSV